MKREWDDEDWTRLHWQRAAAMAGARASTRQYRLDQAFDDFAFGSPLGGGRGRKRRGDVRAALLLLLREEPRNGYQLMQEIEQRSDGRWRPSPGSVYPALAQLEDEGLIRAIERDGSKLLEITDGGREQVSRGSDAAPPWAADDDSGTRSFSEMRSLLMQTGKAAWQVVQVGDQRQTAQACEILADARRALYRILAEDGDG